MRTLMAPKYKVTRARSKEKKDDQFERIIQAGIKLFQKKGSEGFSLRNLADELGMTKNNLYNYVSSKRELWLAIRNKFYSQYYKENRKIVEEHEGTTIDLLLELSKQYAEFAKRDYAVFRMMFATSSAPLSDKVGKIEKAYKEFRLLDGTTRTIQKAKNDGEINPKNPAMAALFLYSLLFGVNYVNMNRREGNPVLENIQLSIDDISNEEFYEYVLNIVEKLLKSDML